MPPPPSSTEGQLDTSLQKSKAREKKNNSPAESTPFFSIPLIHSYFSWSCFSIWQFSFTWHQKHFFNMGIMPNKWIWLRDEVRVKKRVVFYLLQWCSFLYIHELDSSLTLRQTDLSAESKNVFLQAKIIELSSSIKKCFGNCSHACVVHGVTVSPVACHPARKQVLQNWLLQLKLNWLWNGRISC